MSQKPGKKYEAAAKQVASTPYQLADAVTLVQKIKFTKFDETVEVHLRLGVDPSMPTRWFAARWFCRTGSESRRKFW